MPQVRKNKLQQLVQTSVNIGKRRQVFEKQDKQTKFKTPCPVPCREWLITMSR